MGTSMDVDETIDIDLNVEQIDLNVRNALNKLAVVLGFDAMEANVNQLYDNSFCFRPYFRKGLKLYSVFDNSGKTNIAIDLEKNIVCTKKDYKYEFARLLKKFYCLFDDGFKILRIESNYSKKMVKSIEAHDKLFDVWKFECALDGVDLERLVMRNG